jgi:group II intron reverse transcriptase/maturase
MEEALSPENWHAAWKAVVANDGAPGVDGMKCEELVPMLKQHGEKIRAKLLAGTYVPNAVKRVIIPKPGGGERHLSIPTVLDRFVQQLLLGVLSPIWEARFSKSSYGFRLGRSQHDAVLAAQKHIQEGKTYVVDLDIEKFFDRVNHDILMSRIGQVISDKRVKRLIGQMLRAGVMVEGVVMDREEGTPQGGPLSPLLANIYLDALDKEIEARGHAHVRYADDCNIYVGSQAAAERVKESISHWIESRLRLKVNESKSGSGGVKGRKFLGFSLDTDGTIQIATQSLARFKDRVRELWDARQSKTNKQMRDQWNQWLKGWIGYYRLGERKAVAYLESWIRRRIRCYYWQRWHNAKGRYAKLRKLGVKAEQAKAGRSSKGAWRMAKHPAMHTALSNAAIRKARILMPSELRARQNSPDATAGCGPACPVVWEP